LKRTRLTAAVTALPRSEINTIINRLKVFTMRKLDHIGIPTKVVQIDENYMEGAKVFVTDYANSANKIEWLRFELGSEFPELIQTTAHIAYQVEDLKSEMEGKTVLIEPFSPKDGLTIAFVEEEGAPIELMQIKA